MISKKATAFALAVMVIYAGFIFHGMATTKTTVAKKNAPSFVGEKRVILYPETLDILEPESGRHSTCNIAIGGSLTIISPLTNDSGAENQFAAEYSPRGSVGVIEMSCGDSEHLKVTREQFLQMTTSRTPKGVENDWQ